MTQSLRRSQFITTYGPGAILEGPNGPRVIPTLAGSGLFDQHRPAEFEITDQRLSQALLDGAGILRLPSNAELGQADSEPVYETFPFPAWALCTTHGLLYRKTNREDSRACPRCGPLANKYEAYRQVRRQAIRFVRACERGHLDDVDWRGIISHTRNDCNPSYFYWRGGGGALRHVNIECPNCGAHMNLGLAYSREWLCSGRFPELGRDRPGDCNVRSKIIQRGAANLRMAELRTALTIPPRATRLHRLMEMEAIRAVLVSSPISSKADLLAALERLAQNALLRPSTVSEIANYPEQTVMATIGDVTSGPLPATEQNLRLEEFAALSEAATNGSSPLPSPTPGAPPQFEVIKDRIRSLQGPGGHALRITPVDRLRVVTVQTGYRRLDPLNRPVARAYDGGQRDWFPGVELFGEGIFIDLAPDSDSGEHFPLEGTCAYDWLGAWIDPEGFGLEVPDNRHELHPVFVWWHTLSHRLINALSIDSGYSSAAVGERVFVDVDEDSGDARGGVLLYTAQPGGDGTLGGMVALVREFERVMETVFRDLDSCSNDPLCGEERFSPGKYSGAACYACALVSETSCEHRNLRLDRNLLLQNLP